MRPSKPDVRAKASLELIEEAVHLLRAVSLAVLARYYIGTLPFVLGALYYWSDMSRSPVAHQHLAEAALAIAILFLWMKFWQAIFGGQLRATLGSAQPTPLTVKSRARIISRQSLLQATSLFLVPMALFLVVP